MNFCKTYGFNTLLTYNALQLLDRNSVIILSQEFFRKATLQITVSPVNLTFYLIKNPGIDDIVKSILRTYGGIYDQPLVIDHTVIAKKSGAPLAKIHQVLLQLQQDDLAVYDHTHFDTAVTFLVQREDDLTVNRIAKPINTQNTRKVNQVKSILGYLENNSVCRSTQLLAYFEEELHAKCGMCDVCLTEKRKKTKPDDQAVQNKILALLASKPYSSKSLNNVLSSVEEPELLAALKVLLESNKITLTPTNLYKRL